MVLLPYEITLFSNLTYTDMQLMKVLLPYEITLFSNITVVSTDTYKVLLPYEITLFSNILMSIQLIEWFYYLMKSHYSQT